MHSVGTEVLIHGMQNATHLNGQTGRIVNMRYLLERYFVQIDNTKTLICVPFQNVSALRICPKKIEENVSVYNKTRFYRLSSVRVSK